MQQTPSEILQELIVGVNESIRIVSYTISVYKCKNIYTVSYSHNGTNICALNIYIYICIYTHDTVSVSRFFLPEFDLDHLYI